MNVLALIVSVIGILNGLFLAYKWGSTQKKLNTALAKKNQSMLEDLELATTEQLMQELRGRPNFPYLMLVPLTGEEVNGITIEVHNIPPASTVQMLAIATKITMTELKKRGVELPNLPAVFDQEWDASDDSDV